MKIKVFIVTYKNKLHLNNNIQSLIKSDLMQHDYEIIVINNHTEFSMDNYYDKNVKVLHNVVRPNFSKGHLARDWNCALIHGFGDLMNPISDIVVHCQDDTLFSPDWCSNIINLHKKYTFIQYGWGDNFCSYTVDAVKKIGLWDERFCNIGQQEADYLLRAYIYNREKSSINDDVHNRVSNREHVSIIDRPEHETYTYHSESTLGYNRWSDSLYISKWGFPPGEWKHNNVYSNPPKCSLIKNYVYYPYFEKDVEDLAGKNYLVPRH